MEWFEYLLIIILVLFVVVVASLSIYKKIKEWKVGCSACASCNGNCLKKGHCSKCEDLIRAYRAEKRQANEK